MIHERKIKAQQSIKRLESVCLIDGELLKVNKSFDVINPCDAKEIGNAAFCELDIIEKAVNSAKKASLSWKKINPITRGDYLNKCYLELLKHEDELINILTLETGKAIKTESRPEVAAFFDIIKFYSGLGSELKGETIPLDPENMLAITKREPVGVVAAVIPWNVPLLLMSLKVCPAILAGNTVIVKTSENAPFSVLRAAEIMNYILPKGVLNIISGDGLHTGRELVKNEQINKVSFTGSVNSGKNVYSNSTTHMASVTLELGGKSPMIICEDVDLDNTVQGAITGMRFTRQGQSCTAASRIYVHKSLFDQFIAKLKIELDKLVIGDPFDENTDIGAIISSKQYNNIVSYIQSAKGVKIITCSELPSEINLKDGFFLQPTIIVNPPHYSNLIKDEIFGPVCCVMEWENFDDVIEKANDSDYGLAATIWTKNISKALVGANKLEAGLVQVNQNLVVKSNLPFGGFKNSGLGQEATKEAMLEHYTKRKTILINYNC